MASTYAIQSSSSYDGRTMTLYLSQSYDIGANKSTIYWNLHTEGGSSWYATGPTEVYIDGNCVYYADRQYGGFPSTEEMNTVQQMYITTQMEQERQVYHYQPQFILERCLLTLVLGFLILYPAIVILHQRRTSMMKTIQLLHSQIQAAATSRSVLRWRRVEILSSL